MKERVVTMRSSRLLIALAFLVGATAEAQTVFDVAAARRLPEGAPKASDVIMRSLRIRTANEKDPLDTLQALRDFHVTRLEWAYINNSGFIQKVRSAGCFFGGAVSAPSYSKENKGPEWFEQVVIVDLDGNPIIAPWKRNWSRTLWGCMNNPELERGYLEDLKRYIDAGAQVMQRDEPEGNLNAARWGGCFCAHCMAAFRVWLGENTTGDKRAALGIADLEAFDYRAVLKEQDAPVGDAFGKWKGGELKNLFVEFQTQATVAFHQRTRAAIDAHAGRRVPFSCNNGARHWGEVHLGFDWTFGELSFGHARPQHIDDVMRQAVELDRCQVVSMPKSTKWQETLEEIERRTRQTTAMSYACGGHCMAPWDVYMPGDTPRYFGTPEQYADLFGFIRAAAPYLDGYEEAGVAGYALKETRYGDTPPVSVTGNDHCCAVVRVVPGRPDLPVAIHLVDWNPSPKPVALRLNLTRFFGDAAFTARLMTPREYVRSEHEHAQESGTFDGLAQTASLEVSAHGDIAVPALIPWGIMLVEKEK
jgi:hypothetical protein